MKKRFTTAWGLLIFFSFLLFLACFVSVIVIDKIAYDDNVNLIKEIVNFVAVRVAENPDLAEVERVAVPIIHNWMPAFITVDIVIAFTPALMTFIRSFWGKARHASLGLVIAFFVINLIVIGTNFAAGPAFGVERSYPLYGYIAPFFGTLGCILFFIGHTIQRYKDNDDRVKKEAMEKAEAIRAEIPEEKPAEEPEAPEAPKAEVKPEPVKPEPKPAAPKAEVKPAEAKPAAPKAKKRL